MSFQMSAFISFKLYLTGVFVFSGGIAAAAQQFPSDVAGYFLHIAHYLRRVFEHVIIDTLQDVAVFVSIFRAVAGAVGGVDMAVSQLLTIEEIAGYGKMVTNSGNALRDGPFSQFIRHGLRRELLPGLLLIFTRFFCELDGNQLGAIQTGVFNDDIDDGLTLGDSESGSLDALERFRFLTCIG